MIVELFLLLTSGIIYIYQSDQLSRLAILHKEKMKNKLEAKDNDYQEILKKEISHLGL